MADENEQHEIIKLEPIRVDARRADPRKPPTLEDVLAMIVGQYGIKVGLFVTAAKMRIPEPYTHHPFKSIQIDVHENGDIDVSATIF